MASVHQMEAVRSGKLDAGFIFDMVPPPAEFGSHKVAQQRLVLGAPKGHPVARLKKLRLCDLRDAPFIWFQRWVDPLFYDRLLDASLRGGLTTPRIVQHVPDHATMLSLVSCRLGVAFVSEATRWQYPHGVVLRPVVDLDFPLPFYLIWKEGNSSPLLQSFVTQDQLAGRDP